MKKKRLVMELVERERAYFAEQEPGSPEYCASQKRLMDLEKLAKEMRTGDVTWERIFKIALETIKVIGGIALPLIGLTCITAAEKEITFTGALKEYTRLFLPKRN